MPDQHCVSTESIYQIAQWLASVPSNGKETAVMDFEPSPNSFLESHCFLLGSQPVAFQKKATFASGL